MADGGVTYVVLLPCSNWGPPVEFVVLRWEPETKHVPVSLSHSPTPLQSPPLHSSPPLHFPEWSGRCWINPAHRDPARGCGCLCPLIGYLSNYPQNGGFAFGSLQSGEKDTEHQTTRPSSQAQFIRVRCCAATKVHAGVDGNRVRPPVRCFSPDKIICP